MAKLMCCRGSVNCPSGKRVNYPSEQVCKLPVRTCERAYRLYSNQYALSNFLIQWTLPLFLFSFFPVFHFSGLFSSISSLVLSHLFCTVYCNVLIIIIIINISDFVTWFSVLTQFSNLFLLFSCFGRFFSLFFLLSLVYYRSKYLSIHFWKIF